MNPAPSLLAGTKALYTIAVSVVGATVLLYIFRYSSAVPLLKQWMPYSRPPLLASATAALTVVVFVNVVEFVGPRSLTSHADVFGVLPGWTVHVPLWAALTVLPLTLTVVPAVRPTVHVPTWLACVAQVVDACDTTLVPETTEVPLTTHGLVT